MMKHLCAIFLLLSSTLAFGKTVSSIAIAPQGAVLQAGSTQQFTVACTYSDGTSDDCTVAGGAAWSSSRTAALTVNSSGLATWVTDPGANAYGQGYVIVSAGGVTDKAAVFGQHPGDTWTTYVTPDPGFYAKIDGTLLPMNVVVGSTVALGYGFQVNGAQNNPLNPTCNWTSSDTTIATVNRIGDVTAVSPGSVTITCGRAGNGTYGTGNFSRWIAPGNVINLTIVNGGASSQTWYVRPDGGTPFTNSTDTPAGQCDGKHDAPYPGTGVNQPCAMGNLRYLWENETGYLSTAWIIQGGDTVIVRQKSGGYPMNADQPNQPSNCHGDDFDCFMPTVPSGTASNHTRILGENYANCTADSSKTQLYLTWGGLAGFNVRDSQFVDISCFDISDHSAYGGGNFTNTCPSQATTDCGGQFAIFESALTASVTYTDIFAHGLEVAIRGATGIGVVANRFHSRGNFDAGIDMDDNPFLLANVSVAGGFTMTNSITEFSGCVEEYPVVHNYPYIECRDQNTGGYGDGLGTGSTTGNWYFDHDLWFANFQDGLDLLHSGMHQLVVTNSQSLANDGQAYKIGSGDDIVFQNNVARVDCARILHLFGDEPASAIVPGVSPCRAAGDGVLFNFTDQGTYTVQDNSFAGYNGTMLDLECELGWDYCQNAGTVFENNMILGYANSFDGGSGQTPGVFYLGNPSMPANYGWAVRDHNFYYNIRYCPTPMQADEICNTASPQLTGQPTSPIASPLSLDNFSFVPTSASSLLGAGIAIPSITSDIAGMVRPNPPAIGADEFSAGTPLASSTVTLATSTSSSSTGQTVTLTASVGIVGSTAPTGTIAFMAGGTMIGSATLSSGTAIFSTTSLAVGTTIISASYSGDSNYAAANSNTITQTVSATALATPVVTLGLSTTAINQGQSVTLSGTVLSLSGTTPTGTVSFSIGGTTVGTATLNGSGVATFVATPIASGSLSVTANYSGDSNYNSKSSNSSMLTVTAGSTNVGSAQTTPAITLGLSAGTISLGQSVTLTASVSSLSGTTPTGSVSFSVGGAVVGSAPLNGSGIATLVTTPTTSGSLSVTASYSGDSNYAIASSNATSLTVNGATSGVTITVGQPEFGFNVIPGSTRRIYATVANGSSNQVSWALKSGSATLSSTSGSWIDVAAPATGSSCSMPQSAGSYSVTSATQFTVEATAVDNAAQKADVTFNVCNPTVQISVVPFYRTLYAKQAADVQSLIVGSVNQNVHWAITSSPLGGDGKLGDTTSRDTVFSATVPGRYQLTATSAADTNKTATAILYVSGHTIPYTNPVTPNMTEPVDCSVDPTSGGTVYEVGPSQAFKTLASVPFPTMAPGSTVRVHNEDTSGMNPTVYHEYVQISQAGTGTQPIRVCGVPDSAGNEPIIDGANATGRSDASNAIGGLGLLTLHTDNNTNVWPNFSGAAYVVVEGIHFRNAKAGYSYTAPNGSSASWSSSSACVRVNQGQNLAFVGNDFENCGNGVYSAWNGANGWGSSDLNVLWEGNHLHSNGVASSADSHQMYLEAWGEVVQFNRLDNFTSGGLGANLKSRGLEDIIRYNYFANGPQRQMDLVDVTDAATYMSFSGFLDGGANSYYATHPTDGFTADQLAAEQEAWNWHFAYGNMYQNSLSMNPIHFSMDTNGGEQARKGSLFWFNNTFYQMPSLSGVGQTLTLFDTSAGNGNYIPQVEFPTVQSYNNIVWLTSTTSPAFQWNNYDAFNGVFGLNVLTAGWGTNDLAGGTGTGWNSTANSTAYQNAGNLASHLTGNTQITTASTIPFNTVSWALTSDVPGNQSVPNAVCELPTRFSYMPNIGYAVVRITNPNAGAADTVAEASSMMTTLSGPQENNTHYSNCR